MRGIVLITLFTLILNFRMPQYDTGNIVIVTSYTGHILEAQSAVPRQIVHDIQFSIVFEIAPQIFIQSSLLDWSIGTPNGYIERASFITTKGFKIHGIAVTPSPVYSLYVYWLAVNDDRIQVITFDTWDVKELKTGTGQREVPFELVHTLKDATQGIISVTGIKHLAYNPIVELSIDIITSESVKVSAKSYSLSQLEYLRFNILLGTDQSLWTTSKLSLINGPTHPFVSRSPSAYHLYMKFDLPNLYYNYEQIPLVAFRGYDCDNRVNLRLLYKDVAINTQLQFTLATWSDSVVYSVFYQAGIYLFDSNHKIFDENCAELFSECNFQGFSLKVCNKISNLLNKGWSQLVKSVTVPKQKKLLLFQYTNFEGEQSAIIQNQKCMEANVQSVNFNPTVSFIKILFLNSNGGVGVAFYSECYYQGASFSIIKGQQAKLSSKIPFEIKSIDIPANVIVKLKDAYFFGAEVKEFSSSQNCINTYKFPKYIYPN
ncbi:unnamed protein product [Paramecium octaurelia]|uniref:Beta/gamma crystallin 'Greek key' domain-containing protein n=1 Tax=Paramecium octaurelia TaxID=43137 RepID=A0A8S1W401_PAROT|nr:unnamed protein product [Paramecium octaurelia]